VDLYGWYFNIFRSLDMEKVLKFLIVACLLMKAVEWSPPLIAEECFWPPDMVPHPSPPSPEHTDDENWAEHQ
jgi:hypothetical protein